jgi:DNA polymerase III epsilon subunit-like protein
MTLVFFDFETGGLEINHPNIQLAALAVSSDFVELESFETKLQFDVQVADPAALAMNNYDPDVWQKEAVPVEQAIDDFAAFLNRHKTVSMISKRTGRPYSVARLAGHNVEFDKPRLRAMFGDRFLPAHPQCLCTVNLALWFFHFADSPPPENYKLSTLCQYFDIEMASAHDALSDVKASARLAERISREWRILHPPEDLMRF